LRYKIAAPNGAIIFSGEDSFGKQIRRFYYTPDAPGKYTLKVSDAKASNGKRLSWLQLNRNDNSPVLSRIGHLWPIELGVWSPFYPTDQIPGHTVNWTEWAGNQRQVAQ
jgi:hypothetical protein